MIHDSLVIGGTGAIGKAIVSKLGCASISRSVGDFDIETPANAWPELPTAKMVFICCPTINVENTLTLVDRLVASGSFVVFLSSNRVFNGKDPYPGPLDSICPVDWDRYGNSKAEIEREIWQWHPHIAIVRLTKVFYTGMPIMDEWSNNLKSGKRIEAETSLVCPVLIDDAVETILDIAARRLAGIHHLSGKYDIPWYRIALMVEDIVCAGSGRVGMRYVRDTRFTCLDSSDPERLLGFTVRDPQDIVNRCL